MFERVVVPTDFSEPAEAVVSCVPSLEAAGLREVVLVHVLHVVNTPGLEEMLRASAEPELARQAEQLRAHGLEVRTQMRVGVPAVALADIAREERASAIVVGSHGRSALTRILLGSVSMELLHHATVPVLLVRVHLCETEHGISCEVQCADTFAHVLFPTDFSEPADQALAWLKGVIAQTGARVTLLHVQDRVVMKRQMDRLEEFNREDARRLEAIASELRAAGASAVATEIRLGAPAGVIADVVTEQAISLVVMGTRGRGAIEDLVVGSVALRVARKSPVPVVFVPQGL
ncbi:MAG: universal stress protein [Armatimonadota bacterium]